MPIRLKELLLVFAGGAVGTGLRFGAEVVGGDGLWPLFAVNIVGAFGLGWYLSRFPMAPGHVHGFFAVGLLGSLTTFSAFAVETVLLADSGAWGGAAVWVLGSIVVGIAAAIAGRFVGSTK